MTVYSPLDPRLTVHGRTVRAAPLPLFWTASGLEFLTDASTLAFDLETVYTACDIWVRVELDGVTVLRAPLPQGRTRLRVFRDIPAGVHRRVRLFKETQPMPPDPGAVLLVHGIECDGALFTVPPRPRRIEFIGDSLTSGEGLAGPPGLLMGGTLVFSCQNNYALLAAEALDADCRLLSQSGWGIAVSWDNDPACTLPPYYEQVCSVTGGAHGGGQPNDFAAWQPDAVVIHLGNNDAFALNEPPHRDPVTGAVTKLCAGPDGGPDAAAAARIKDAAKNFLHTVRRRNPKAHIAWAYGMLGSQLLDTLQKAVAAYKAESGDTNVSFAVLPPADPAYNGSNGHPGLRAHAAAAAALCEHLRCYL